MREIKVNVPVDDNKKKCSLLLCVLTLFHIVAVCLFYFVSIYGIVMFFTIPEELLKNRLVETVKLYTPLYLTNWNFTFQTIFLTMSLVYDVMVWINKHESKLGRKLKYYRDVMFSGVVVPVTMFVSTMFWTIYWIDRELVFPKIYDQVVPWWFNHCVHTNITIVVLVETILQERRHPTNFKLELILNGGIGILYAIVYYSIYFFANRWLYGVFGIMTWWQVCLYQLLIWASMYFFYFLQFPINRIFHREPAPETKNGVDNGIGETKTVFGDKDGVPDMDKNRDSLKLRSKNESEHSSL